MVVKNAKSSIMQRETMFNHNMLRHMQSDRCSQHSLQDDLIGERLVEGMSVVAVLE
jgi:hypothetical protein